MIILTKYFTSNSIKYPPINHHLIMLKRKKKDCTNGITKANNMGFKAYNVKYASSKHAIVNF